MPYDHYLRSAGQDRDLSRTAAERYVLLQAVAERRDHPRRPVRRHSRRAAALA